MSHFHLIALICTVVFAGRATGQAFDTQIGLEGEMHSNGNGNGSYLENNEEAFYLFNRMLPKSGAIISVGNRLLESMSAGGDHGIQIDIDPGTVKFMRSQRDLLRQEISRGDFLARLLDRPHLKAIFDSMLENPTPETVARVLKVLAEEKQLVEVPALREAYATNSLKSPQAAFDCNRLDYVSELLRLHLQSNGFDDSPFIFSQARFARLQALAREGKLHVRHGSLADGETLQLLSQQLRANRIQISAIDVSNVPDYIFDLKQTAKFLSGLESLPMAAEARVHFTASYIEIPATDPIRMQFPDKWGYYSVPFAQYLSFLRDNRNMTYKKYRNLLVRNFQGSEFDLKFQHCQARLTGGAGLLGFGRAGSDP